MTRSTILAALALLAVACGGAVEPAQFRLIGENTTATDAVAPSSAGPTWTPLAYGLDGSESRVLVRVTTASVGARLNHLHMSARMGDSTAAPVLLTWTIGTPGLAVVKGTLTGIPPTGGLLNVEAFADDENETTIPAGGMRLELYEANP